MEVSRALPGLESFPVRTLTLFRLSASLVWQILLEPPESSVPCWRTVATVYPLGNCDSAGPETFPAYLIRLGAVSNRSSPLSPFFAFTDDARTSPEELVNSASATLPCGLVLEGLNQPAWFNLSPVAWDYPRDLRRLSFVQLRLSVPFSR
jgi:hypothetical protein